MGCSGTKQSQEFQELPPATRPTREKGYYTQFQENIGYSSIVSVTINCGELFTPQHCSSLNPFCVAYIYDNESGIWIEFSRTEVILNISNPSWKKILNFSYVFEEIQRIRCDIFTYCGDTMSVDDVNKLDLADHMFLGAYELTLGNIMGSRGTVHGLLVLNNYITGQITLHGEEDKQSREELRLYLELQHTSVTLDKKKLFIECQRQQIKDNSPKSTFITCYKSEVTLDGTLFIRVSLAKICYGNRDLPIKFLIHETAFNQHTCLGMSVSAHVPHTLTLTFKLKYILYNYTTMCNSMSNYT